MYEPGTGKAHKADTYYDHLYYESQGYTHASESGYSDEPIIIEIPREWFRIAFTIFFFYLAAQVILYMAGN